MDGFRCLTGRPLPSAPMSLSNFGVSEVASNLSRTASDCLTIDNLTPCAIRLFAQFGVSFNWPEYNFPHLFLIQMPPQQIIFASKHTLFGVIHIQT